ncbi:MAG: phytoene dehydrogenase-like protein [Arenicella sp.]|jgi:phytoene dehydrogenase-like protein
MPRYLPRAAAIAGEALRSLPLGRIADFEFFLKWKNFDHNQRIELEKAMTEAILKQVVYTWFPEVDKYIEYTKIDTPMVLAVERNSYEDGAVYGLQASKMKMTDLGIQPESQIDNLYFTGANVITLATTTVMIAGILTASTVVDHNLLKKYIKQLEAN